MLLHGISQANQFIDVLNYFAYNILQAPPPSSLYLPGQTSGDGLVDPSEVGLGLTSRGNSKVISFPSLSLVMGACIVSAKIRTSRLVKKVGANEHNLRSLSQVKTHRTVLVLRLRKIFLLPSSQPVQE